MNPATVISLFPAGVRGFASDFGAAFCAQLRGPGSTPDDASLAGAFRQLRIRRLGWLKRRAVEPLADNLLQDGAGIDGKIVIPGKGIVKLSW